MGKRIIQQRRGRGTNTYKNFNQKGGGKTSYNLYNKDRETSATIIDILHSKSHSAPLMKIKYETGKQALMPAFQGAYIGQELSINHKDQVAREEIKQGNAYMLKNIPEGTTVYNIEATPGDSGRLVKAGGNYARVLAHIKGMTKISLPSKKEKFVKSTARAFVGEIGGGGRLEKPFLKAGDKAKFMAKTNKLYPRTSGVAMSAYDHPLGSSRSLRKGRPTIAPVNAPPGRKVGMLRPRHTGRNR